MGNKHVIVDRFRFFSNETPADYASPDGTIWRKKDTSAAGAPTMVGAGGEMVLTLAATEEIENLCLYFGDVLPYDIDHLLRVDFWARCSASLAVGVDVAFGLAAARNDAIDSIAYHALFRVIGAAAAAGAVTVETDDGVNDNDDKATGQTLAATLKRFTIDFASGLTTISPPSASVGGKANVLFSMDNGSGLLTPVARNTRFDMSNYSSGLQLFAQLQKAAQADVASLYIRAIDVTRKEP